MKSGSGEESKKVKRTEAGKVGTGPSKTGGNEKK